MKTVDNTIALKFDASAVNVGMQETSDLLAGLKAIAEEVSASISTIIGMLSEKIGQLAAAQTSGPFDWLLKGGETIEGIEKTGEVLNGVLEDFNKYGDDFNIFMSLLPEGTKAFSSAFGKMTEIFGEIGERFSGLSSGWQLAIVAIISVIILLIDNWDMISAKVQEVWGVVQAKLSEFGAFIKGIFAKDWTEQFGAIGNVLNAFFANVESIWNAIKRIFNGIIGFVKNVFAGDWGAAWDSIVEIFMGIWDYIVAAVKAPINGIIGYINGLVQAVVGGINMVIGALNGVSFDIPDWVPLIGGQTFEFNIAPLTAPKIPLLAQGAVLPANKPFLAVVGDQKHGTNIEAPLATIQQALADVLAQQGNDIHIRFTGDLAQLGRVLKPVIDRENRRVGGSLAKGAV